MYGGQIVETGPAARVLTAPAHPYTEGLLRAVPSIEDVDRGLAVIPGRVPEPNAWPDACRFHPRCPYAWERCRQDEPPLGRGGRCWLADEPERRSGVAYRELSV
jgi:oligopeptide/dipeptide ABC transporter ATP-binding protein